jgi:hypothetical protein
MSKERKITITVWENTYSPLPASDWSACYDDYDLDVNCASGATPEEAVIELVSLWDLPK